MRRFDVVIMFGSLWLLASMVIDVATPRELSVYMTGAAIAPAIAITAFLYWLRVPGLDFAVSFATLWLVSGTAIELITPKPLSQLFVIAVFAPMVIVGIVINFQNWRRSRREPSDSQVFTSSDCPALDLAWHQSDATGPTRLAEPAVPRR